MMPLVPSIPLAGDTLELALFPLGTVLFPGGLLPLKIFEQRYLDMTKACVRDNVPFGVCLISEGGEVGAPATPHAVGCTAAIEQWDMPNPSMFHLLARGGDRFEVIDTRVEGQGLLRAHVRLLPAAAAAAPDPQCVAILKRVIESAGEAHFPAPLRLEDGAWVAYRLTEMMNLPMPLKQHMLEMTAVDEVFAAIRAAMGNKGAASGES